MEKMVINKLQKIIEQYQKYTFVNATKNLIYHWQTREKRISFGSLNTDKTFYVIRSIDDKNRFYIGPINNLLANYFYVLSHLAYAQKNGWIPVIDMLNYPVYNSLPYPVNGTMNAWEYFWQQPSSYTLDEVYQSKNVILSKQNWFSQYDMGYEPSHYEEKEIIKKFFQLAAIVPLNSKVENIINQKSKEILKNKKNILGIAFRFGGHSKKHFAKATGHPVQPDIEEITKLAKIYLDKWGMQYIFLTSDTEEAVQAFKKIFKSKLIVLKRKRFSELLKKGEINNLYSQENLYQTSLNYLTEMILLSRCDCLIGSINSGLRYAVIQNNCKYKNVKILNYGLL